jgi:hypothetical protein
MWENYEQEELELIRSLRLSIIGILKAIKKNSSFIYQKSTAENQNLFKMKVIKSHIYSLALTHIMRIQFFLLTVSTLLHLLNSPRCCWCFFIVSQCFELYFILFPRFLCASRETQEKFYFLFLLPLLLLLFIEQQQH